MPPKSSLVAPVTYQGGKTRIAEKIVDQLWAGVDNYYYDLCCGSGAIAIELFNRGVPADHITMVDAGPWGLVWQAIGNKTFDLTAFDRVLAALPSDRTLIQDAVEALAKQDTAIDTAYVFLVLQAGAFGSKPIWLEGSKWVTPGFRGFWLPTETSSRRYPVNPMMPMPDTLRERMLDLTGKLAGVKGVHGDVRTTPIEPSAVVYVDPPYVGTVGYGFDLDVVSFAKSLPNKTYVSEGKPLGPTAIKISGSDERTKGGVSGKKGKTPNEEWLTIFNERSGP